MNPQTGAKIPLRLTQWVGDTQKALAQFEQVEFTKPTGQNFRVDNTIYMNSESLNIRNKRQNERDFEYKE